MTPVERDLVRRLRDHSGRLLAEALQDGVSSKDAQSKLRLRGEIESHLLALDALVEIGATRQAITRTLEKLSERLEERQPA